MLESIKRLFTKEPRQPCPYWDTGWVVVYESLVQYGHGHAYDLISCYDGVLRSSMSSDDDIRKLADVYKTEHEARIACASTTLANPTAK